ncbi:MAG: radical SAM protein [Syntrophales bacterium]|nr:radical SAM protein [Syntrophales bacterium]
MTFQNHSKSRLPVYDGEHFFFEMGPIRPPSEGSDQSLLIRTTRNCCWNRCEFCGTYRGEKFSLRPVAEIKQDIDVAGVLYEELQTAAAHRGPFPGVGPEVVRALWVSNPQLFGDNTGNLTRKWQNLHNVANWLNSGARTVFLQDADALIMRTGDLLEVLSYLKATFPTVTRVTAYARSQSCYRKSLTELTDLRRAGLLRLHVGLESGCDAVLKRMKKGVGSLKQVEGGQKVVAAGISLCEYLMPGLGGKELSERHALDSAAVLSAINPAYIRLRTLALRSKSPLLSQSKEGLFTELSEDEVVAEIALLVANLHCSSYLVSDQMSNLLYGVEGQLPQDKEKILEVINAYLQKPEPERMAFRLRQRQRSFLAVYGSLPESLEEQVEQAWDALRREAPEAGAQVDAAIAALKEGFV